MCSQEPDFQNRYLQDRMKKMKKVLYSQAMRMTLFLKLIFLKLIFQRMIDLMLIGLSLIFLRMIVLYSAYLLKIQFFFFTGSYTA